MPGSNLAVEKLSQAVRELDMIGGQIQERLAKAATYLMQIGPQDLSDDEMRRMLVGIKDDLTFAEPEGNEDRIAGTLRKTDEADANAIATRIVKLYRGVYRGQATHSAGRHASGKKPPGPAGPCITFLTLARPSVSQCFIRQ